ncbi:pyridoxine 5'-phosphate synthase [Pontibacter sp. G13]|uniref:pyridoxine 5'-phosphate synthase n=1 Tax=Pontibacter sp. G13 TaxID=3074898 RepID=UPI00288C58B7|nr:pyridoxine 5'-phosphate synthase [Pontibacter sp. G13]WNJ16306.1 pyridoxine 5'-phosphate synthase [Pontibacter sp. G13]
MSEIQLSVNLNKVALIRNSRGRNLPDLEKVAQDAVAFGADGITLHPRPDERHAKKADIYTLKHSLQVELNVEGYPSEEFLRMIEKVKPAQCTLVPDPPEALTSNAGWDTLKNKYLLLDIIQRIQSAGVRASIFVETNLDHIEAAREIGTDRIELYTEAYATEYANGNPDAVAPYARSAAFAHELGLGVNAGHDLNLDNLAHFAKEVPNLAEVSIGHALVCDALYYGLETTIKRYKECLAN